MTRERNSESKTNGDMGHTDSEKEYDRQTVTATIKLILKLGDKIEF